MTFLQAIILGIIQGLTEFLPISSSAHLVIAPYLLGWEIPVSQAFVFDVLVQMGTLVAVIIYFWKDLIHIIRDWVYGVFHKAPFGTPNARLGWYLILASIPAGLLGITIKSKVETVFNSPLLTAALLYGTAILLVIAEKIGKRVRSLNSLGWKDALWIGFFQAIAIFPGISRSGATISGGMTRDLDRPAATRFSFLMSIPIMLAAGLIGVLDMRKIPQATSFLPVMAVGFIVAGIVGYISIRWLLSYISRRSFYPFAIYCAVFATLVIGFGLVFQPKTSAAEAAKIPITKVAISPTLTWLSPMIDLCAASQSGLVIATQESAHPASSGSDFALQVDENENSAAQGIILGTETIEFVVNNANPTDSLDLATIQSILSGATTSWPQGTSLRVYAYAPDSEISKIISTRLLANSPLAPASRVEPHPQEVLLMVNADLTGLGIIPGTIANDSVKVLKIEGAAGADLSMKIIAFYNHNLTEQEKNWLTCIQNGIKAK